MTTMFDRFEIQSEISKSETALIYKALDTKTNQVVALKTQSLEPLGDHAAAFVKTLIAEGESTRDLTGQNIAALYGSGAIEGQFCAAVEYIQGNSIATMVARKEGFSIWDLLDITRQVGAALEKAAALGVVHLSLESAKVMVQWDGLVKVLGYGISNMSLIEAEMGNGLGRLMPYCSPEQIRGETIDQRSNVYTLGTILYEMATGRNAFDSTDSVALVGQIENEMPHEPASVNPKIQPAVSALIMKALAKDPADRYQTARELLQDLEKCKDGRKAAAVEPKKAVSAPPIKVDAAAGVAVATKLTSAAAAVAGVSEAARPEAPRSIATPSVSSKQASVPSVPAMVVPPKNAAQQLKARSWQQAEKSAEPAKSSATAGGAPGAGASVNANSGVRLIEGLDLFSAPSPRADCAAPMPAASAATPEREPDTQSPGLAVDPMMAGPAAVQSGKSFSDIDELPPLREPVSPPSAPELEEPEPPVAPRVSSRRIYPKNEEKEEKPRVQTRALAEKMYTQIATVPPRLMLFSILGAVAVILVVVLAVLVHVRSEDDGSTAAPRPIKAASALQPAASPMATPPAAKREAPVEEARPSLTIRPIERRKPKAPQQPAVALAPVVIPGRAMIDSSPQGAQFQLDGKSDPSWVTPFDLAGLSPGKHILVVSKLGYTSEVRSVDVVSGGKSSLVFHLAPINALVVVNSTPAGADITLDGRPTGRVTPAQFAVEKGSHTVLLKKQGFLDETTAADLGPGQNFLYAPALRALGNAEEIRTVGRFRRMFGNGGDSTTGMGTVSIRTRPRGAQVAINQRVLDKMSPMDVMMGPGTYVVDITLNGFKPVHKVITWKRAERSPSTRYSIATKTDSSHRLSVTIDRDCHHIPKAPAEAR